MMRQFFAMIGLMAVGMTLCAQDAMVTVRKEGSKKEAVTLAGLAAPGPQGKIFVQTLKGDLERSGWFKVGASGSVQVKGTVSDAGGGISSACTVAWPGKQFPWSRTSSAADVRRQAHLLADAMVKHVMGETGMAATRIAMVNYRGPNNADLYVCDADGYAVKRLTQDNKAVVGPRWDPNGQTIFFTSYVKDFPAIYKIGVNGGAKSALVRFPGLNTGAAISPDRSTAALVLSYQGNPELYTLRLGSGVLTRLTTSKYGAEASPCWSPDGRRIVYVSDPSRSPQLYVIDVATRQSRRLTYRGAENVNPSWGRNGKLAFATRRGAGYEVAVMDPAKGEGSVEVVGAGESPSWAIDGRHILCSRKEGTGSALYVLDTMGDPAVRLTHVSGNWICPNWSER